MSIGSPQSAQSFNLSYVLSLTQGHALAFYACVVQPWCPQSGFAINAEPN